MAPNGISDADAKRLLDAALTFAGRVENPDWRMGRARAWAAGPAHDLKAAQRSYLKSIANAKATYERHVAGIMLAYSERLQALKEAGRA